MTWRIPLSHRCAGAVSLPPPRPSDRDPEQEAEDAAWRRVERLPAARDWAWEQVRYRRWNAVTGRMDTFMDGRARR